MDRYSHTGLFFNELGSARLQLFKKKFIGSRSFKIGANVQAILLRGKEKSAEFYLAFFQ